MTAGSRKPGTQALIGAFVLGGTLLVLGTIVLFGNFHMFTPTLRAAIVFQDSISGLAIGAPVSFRGVRVGSVQSISVQFDAQTKIAYIPVIVQIELANVIIMNRTDHDAADLPKVLPPSLRAELDMQSFVTGQSEIDLDFDAASPAVLHPHVTSLPEIPTQQSTMEKMTKQLSKLPLKELTDDASATLKSLRALSEKFNASLPPLIDSLRTTSDRAGDVIGDAGHSIAELQGRLDGTLAEVGRLAATADLQIRQRGGELRTVLMSTNQTVVQARDVLTDLQSFTAERGSDHANIDSALRDLATTAASLRGLASEVEHNPQLLLTGRRQ
jgi:paraquat-inducible protein B